MFRRPGVGRAVRSEVSAPEGRRTRPRGAASAPAVLLAIAAPSVAPVGVAAQPYGSVGPQSRLFLDEPISGGQPRWHELSLAVEAMYERSLGERLGVRATAFWRLAEEGTQRTHFEPREALLRSTLGPVAVDLGIGTVFWGVTESRHLVDVVNQKDYREDFDGEEKLGQLLALVSYDTGRHGLIELYAMSWFRPLVFPTVPARPGAPVAIQDDPAFGGGRDRWSRDYAARWSHAVGALDWGLSWFHGTSREPQLVEGGTAAEPALLLFHDRVDQGGLELQWTRGDWLWKAEGMIRMGQGPSFGAVTVGFEHTSWGVFGTDADVGALAEYSYDGRDNLTFNPYDDDVFGGLRLSLNDIQGSQVLAGALVDVDSGVTLGTLEARRRFADRWTLELEGRFFVSHDGDDPLHWFRRDDHLQITVEYYW